MPTPPARMQCLPIRVLPEIPQQAAIAVATELELPDAAITAALEKFAGSLLEVVDNLERALGSVPSEEPAVKALQEGVSLTHKLFSDTLKRFAVESVDPLGAPFDPEQHQAVSMQPSTTAEPNTVTAVFQKGYTLSGRLLRPAMVVVATAG